ncbi:hypothetical protein LPA44_04075 [Halobacterium sp. KA-4]|uniref:hypothetical protein n=1 Tax=Halobacterium sp. KA-4 TaxID=2896367 RepID=UPI001E4A65DF|nr:hypothetical protein [Halobacterium sp. KA-4]MCD2199076.1 hypothetical protein [Halobacterium sp. KA-4]
MKNPLQWLKRRSASTEDAHEYDGVLSYAGEFHALLIGFAAGFASSALGQPMILAGLFVVALGIKGVDLGKRFAGRGVRSELKREPWYGIGGGLIGWAAGAVATGVALVPSLV